MTASGFPSTEAPDSGCTISPNSRFPGRLGPVGIDSGARNTVGSRLRARGLHRELPLWPAFVSAALTSLVAFIGITRPSIWPDEAATISATDRSYESLMELLSTMDIVHGLYYLVMMPWVEVFGTSSLSIRTPSALMMATGALLTTRITMNYARSAAPHRAIRAGLAAGALYATLPILAGMGQEARGFAFGTAFVLLAWWGYEKWLRSRDDRWLIVLVVGHLLAVYFTLYAAMVVPLYVFRAMNHGRRPGLKAAGAAVVIAAGTLPLVLLALPQRGQIDWISTSPVSIIKRMVSSQFFIGQGISDGPWYHLLQAIAVVLAGLTVAIIAVGMVHGPLRRTQAWLWAWIAFPMLVVFTARLVGGQFYDERYMIFTAPALVVLLALVITVCIPRRSISILALGALIALCLPAVVAQHGSTKNNSDYRRASAILEPANTIYFLDAKSHDITTAYPHETEASDPMLLASAEDSGTLNGHTAPPELAFNHTPSGSIGVAGSTLKQQKYDAVVNHFVSTGCTVVDDFQDEWIRTTLLTCPIL
ncbi:hypothetical protein [Kocuria rhizosphaericola]|uniref:glycosyltransferase family 39 protein n=1 Tax=Kocuria rhizosphaericola TaxID=3376284 RepID=UPI0037A09F6C